MSKDFIIYCDTNTDLPWDYYEKHDVKYLPMGYSINETDYSGAPDDTLTFKEFYDKMRAGALPKTFALTPETVKSEFEKSIKAGYDVLYLAFSSGLSATCNNANIAKTELLEDYPDANIFVVDSLAASLGYGLMLNYAVNLKKRGKSAQETAEILTRDRQSFCQYFTVDDLNHLHRGGRVSKTSAVLGSVLGIKPILHVNNEGKLIPCGKIRGRKKSLDELVAKMESKIQGIDNDLVYISHGDCEEDAKYVAEQIKKKFGIKNFLINYIGNSIGSHSGAGTVALFFLGNNRDEKSM